MRAIKLKDDIFETEVVVYLSTMKEFNRMAKRKGFVPEDEEDTTGQHQVHFKGKATKHIIWVSSKSKNRINILAHEMIHMAMKRFKHLNIPINLANQETFAYFYGAMLGQAVKKLKI